METPHIYRIENLVLLKNDNIAQNNLQIQCAPYQNTNYIFFCKNMKKHTKIHMASQGTPWSQNNFEKKQNLKIHTSWFQNLLQSYSNQNSVVLA